MELTLELEPPTVTAQEHRIRVVNGKPIVYDSARLKAARALLTEALEAGRPDEPMSGSLELTVCWRFHKGKSHCDGEYRGTRPDTDNLQKLLKDSIDHSRLLA